MEASEVLLVLNVNADLFARQRRCVGAQDDRIGFAELVAQILEQFLLQLQQLRHRFDDQQILVGGRLDFVGELDLGHNRLLVDFRLLLLHSAEADQHVLLRLVQRLLVHVLEHDRLERVRRLSGTLGDTAAH